MQRRHYLSAIGVTVVCTLAGCSSAGSDDTQTQTEQTDTDPSTQDQIDQTKDGQSTQSDQRVPWTTPTERLVADDGDANDQFGNAVAVSADGSNAIIGTEKDQIQGNGRTGSAYAFSEAGESWTQQHKFTPQRTSEGPDDFGTSVAISADGTTAVVGAPHERITDNPEAEAAHVFSYNNNSWGRESILYPTDKTETDGEDYDFGISVAASDNGSVVLVGAFRDGSGSAYVFTRSDGTWTQETKLTPADGDDGDAFGVDVALSGDGTTALIGAPWDEDPNGSLDSNRTGAGSAYIFSASDRSWSQESKLAAEDGAPNDNFGTSVALSGDGTVGLIGAPATNNKGAAYLFSSSSGSWTQQSRLTADEKIDNDNFGISVDLSDDGTTALVGGSGILVSDSQTGSAYLFSNQNGSWVQETLLGPRPQAWQIPEFGQSVALSDDGTTACVSAHRANVSEKSESGEVLIYQF